MKAYKHLIRRALAQGFTISVDGGGDELEQFLDQLGIREKRAPKPEQEPPKTENLRQIETNDWYKQGKECPF